VTSAPELRIDPLTGLRVVLAPKRSERPLSFEPARAHEDAKEQCPLCEGHESWTPPETYALRPEGGEPDTPGWLVRAVPNKFPLLAPEHEDPAAEPADLFGRAPAIGAHEVIVHTPEHVSSVGDLSVEQLGLAVGAWKQRSEALAHWAYVHLMVNEGPAAGASLEHSHAQIFGLGFVPTVVARERERFTAHKTRTEGACLMCDLLQEEVRLRERIVAIDDQVVLLAPFASRMPYELQLVPRTHAPTFAFSDTDPAELLHEAFSRLRTVLGAPPPLNLWVRTAPKDAETFHWHIDIVPRITQLAGFELGTGVSVNIVAPERAAGELAGAGAHTSA
jgi:UDPglucose--hexose-1-phosphate uridylyltransferase